MCCFLFCRNIDKIGRVDNLTDINYNMSLADYHQLIKQEKYQGLGLDPCDIENELNKVHKNKKVQRAVSLAGDRGNS